MLYDWQHNWLQLNEAARRLKFVKALIRADQRLACRFRKLVPGQLPEPYL